MIMHSFTCTCICQMVAVHPTGKQARILKNIFSGIQSDIDVFSNEQIFFQLGFNLLNIYSDR